MFIGPALAPPAVAAPVMRAAAIPACVEGQISVGFDSENGNFDGMSQTGTLLVLRNLGPGACAFPAMPELLFADKAGRRLDIVARNPFRGPAGVPLGHGPGVPPVLIPAGAEATAVLHWVSGDVYAGHHCLAAATVSLGSDAMTAAFTGRFCGEPGKPIPFDQDRLKTDPVLPSDQR